MHSLPLSEGNMQVRTTSVPITGRIFPQMELASSFKIVFEPGRDLRKCTEIWVFKPRLNALPSNLGVSTTKSAGGAQHCWDGVRMVWWYWEVLVVFGHFLLTHFCNFKFDLCLLLHTFLVFVFFGGRECGPSVVDGPSWPWMNSCPEPSHWRQRWKHPHASVLFPSGGKVSGMKELCLSTALLGREYGACMAMKLSVKG